MNLSTVLLAVALLVCFSIETDGVSLLRAMPGECIKDGIRYPDGADIEGDTCDGCKCTSGTITCTYVICPSLLCDEVDRYVPPGQCCQVCF